MNDSSCYVPGVCTQLQVLWYCRASEDPALNDGELQKRLSENRKTARKRLDEACLSVLCLFSAVHM